VALAPSEENSSTIRVVGSSTFVLVDGVWMDSRYDPDTMQTEEITFLSDEYFELARENADLATAFALGENVIALSGETIYEVVPGEPDQETQIDVVITSTPMPTEPHPTEIVEIENGASSQPGTVITEAMTTQEETQTSPSNIVRLLPWLALAILGIGTGSWLLIRSRKN
jgi:hypothetical protein